MKLNKNDVYEKIRVLADDRVLRCTKLKMDNIVFPKWSDLGLLGMIFAQKAKTKEQPKGCDYDEAIYQIVMRVINGKVLMTGGRPDAYAWTHKKLEKYITEEIRLIGTNSASAVVNLSKMLTVITDPDEQMMFADMFCSWNKDLILVTTEEEDRLCIEVSQDLYDAGLTACVDSWMNTDENGEAEATLLSVGDFLIVQPDGSFYTIRRAEFMETHIVNG